MLYIIKIRLISSCSGVGCVNFMEIKKGKWKHFKGGIYSVIGVGKHSETLDELVVYEHVGQIWVRPKKMFLENVKKWDKIVPRFEYLGE